MNDLDVIHHLAVSNSMFGRPLRRVEVKNDIPFFEIQKNDLGKYVAVGYNYEGHDNAPRMALWEWYMNSKILPHLQVSNIDCRGFYNIELHDSYTYLNNGKDYNGCLVFSKYKQDKGPVLIPDPYAMQNWGGMLQNIKDTTTWERKQEKICFYGTTTGDRDPGKNDRINMCIWSLKHKHLCDFRITKVAQMSQDSVRNAVGNDVFNNIMTPAVSPEQQMNYKFHLVMDGNTCRFDVWNYLTNSVSFKYASREMLWYYPLLLNGMHFIEVTKDNMIEKMHIDKKYAEFLTDNAKTTFSRVSQSWFHTMYLLGLFESMSQNGK